MNLAAGWNSLEGRGTKLRRRRCVNYFLYQYCLSQHDDYPRLLTVEGKLSKHFVTSLILLYREYLNVESSGEVHWGRNVARKWSGSRLFSFFRSHSIIYDCTLRLSWECKLSLEWWSSHYDMIDVVFLVVVLIGVRLLCYPVFGVTFLVRFVDLVPRIGILFSTYCTLKLTLLLVHMSTCETL